MLFSVVIPIYNKAKVIERAINSVLNQSFKDFEVILVNDGSTDDSLIVANTFAINSNVKIINQNNKGVSVARNVGIMNSNGECITFLDPDDYWLTDHLEILAKIYRKCNSIKAIYSTGYIIHLVNGTEISMKDQIDRMILKGKEFKICNDLFKIYNKFQYGIIHTNSVMIPRIVFDKVGFFVPDCNRSQDVDMWFRVMIEYPAVIIAKESTVYCREESTATAKYTRNFNWPFFDTAEYMLKDGVVRPEIILSLSDFLDELRISMVKHMIMAKERILARNMLKKVKNRKKYLKSYILTQFAFFVPNKLLQYLYKKKYEFFLNDQ